MFPWNDYDTVAASNREIIASRDRIGRNAYADFYDGFPHGAQDVSFELLRRVQRILGAEKTGDLDVAVRDAEDLSNYAIFYVMLCNREKRLRVDVAHATT